MPRGEPNPYGGAWRRLSLQVRREAGGRCEVVERGERCPNSATSTDHIVPVSEAPQLRLVRSNLRATCPKHNQGRVMSRLSRMARLNRQPATVRQW